MQYLKQIIDSKIIEELEVERKDIACEMELAVDRVKEEIGHCPPRFVVGRSAVKCCGVEFDLV